MPVRDNGACFACGRNNPFGLQLDIQSTTDGVAFRFSTPTRFQGWEGIVHGGIVATMLDELIAWACSARGIDAVTGQLTVRYRLPAPISSPIRGIGRIVQEKGRLLLGESRLFDGNGNLIAEASAKMMRV